MTHEFLQNYWWLIMSVLGALLVFMLFVQGGQTMIATTKPAKRSLLVNSLGRKWELTYTTLVTFGGAFFASFPLFYSTSFGGAYWLWIFILFSFVIQAVAYEYRTKHGNVEKAEKMVKDCEENGWVAISMANDWKTIYGDEVTRK